MQSNQEVSGVEYLIKKMEEDNIGKAIVKTFISEFNIAKEIEKQQRINAYNDYQKYLIDELTYKSDKVKTKPFEQWIQTYGSKGNGSDVAKRLKKEMPKHIADEVDAYAEKQFKRAYGFAELAALYFPNINKKSASTQLTRWIRWNEPLKDKLKKYGYQPGKKILTPIQVEIINEFFGNK